MPGGRPAGSLNKNKRALLKLLQDHYPDYHPVLSMAHIANDKENDVALRASMHKEVAAYVPPKLKAVEVQMETQGDIRIGWCDSHTVQSETTTGDPAQ